MQRVRVPRQVTSEARALRDLFIRNTYALMARADLSLAELARGAGLSRNHLNDVLHGRARCSLDFVAQVAEALQVEPAALLMDTLPPDTDADLE